MKFFKKYIIQIYKLLPNYKYYSQKILKFEINKLRFDSLNLSTSEKPLKRYLRKCIINNNIVSGSIPLLNKNVEVIVYNFFSLNYGIRKDLILNISLCDKNFKINKSTLVKLHFRGIKTIKLNKLFEINKDDVFCIISAINHSIPPLHGEKKYHFGHLRFFGFWDKSCYVHSLPLPSPSQLFKNRFGYIFKSSVDRVTSLIPKNSKISAFGGDTSLLLKKINHISNNKPRDFSNSCKIAISNFVGFIFSTNNLKEIKSINHISLNTRIIRQAKIINEESFNHVISIPPIQNFDAYLFFGEACSNNSMFNASLWEQNNSNGKNLKKIEKIISVKNVDYPLKASEIFPELINNQNTFYLSFKPISGKHSNQYINVNYLLNNIDGTQEICDTVHSHTYAKYGYRKCLKFGPFLCGKSFFSDYEADYESYLSIWSTKEFKTNIRIRIFKEDDPSFEFVSTKIIESSCVTTFPLSKIISDKNFIFSGKLISGICQIECEDANLLGSIFIQKKVNNICRSVAVDHLTGG